MKKDEYDEAMRLARQGGPAKSAWSQPKPSKQKNPNEREQLVTKGLFGGEKRSEGRAARTKKR
jgi:hypothetical protein